MLNKKNVIGTEKNKIRQEEGEQTFKTPQMFLKHKRGADSIISVTETRNSLRAPGTLARLTVTLCRQKGSN